MVYTPNCYDWYRKKNKNGGELLVVSRGSKNRCDMGFDSKITCTRCSWADTLCFTIRKCNKNS